VRRCPGGERIKDEQDVVGRLVQASSDALTPIPTPASDTEVIAPHNLAHVGDGCRRLTIDDGVEWLIAQSASQPWGTDVAVEVLSSDWKHVLDRNGVVQVGESVDPRYSTIDAPQ